MITGMLVEISEAKFAGMDEISGIGGVLSPIFRTWWRHHFDYRQFGDSSNTTRKLHGDNRNRKKAGMLSERNSLLQPGTKAPSFSLVGANRETMALSDQAGRRIALLFLPADISEELAIQLARYQDNVSVFADLNAVILAISAASPEELRQLAAEQQIQFALLSDSQKSVWRAYTGSDSNGTIQPTVFVIDEVGVIRASYEASRNPNLPGPLALARTIRKLNEVPKPVPVTELDWRIGPIDAPITLIEYSDYQCQHCREAAIVIEQIAAIYGDQVQIVHRHLPLRQAHLLAQLAAEAAEAAGAQGKFWEMHHRLFVANGALARDDLITYAHELGLDIVMFAEDLDNRRYEPLVNEDWLHATQSGIKLPPTLFINSVLLEGARTKEIISARVESLVEWPKRSQVCR